ncbi:MAG: hypothetical protein RIS35_1850 [Pseudomonadota bacterium]|jgi:hypothetical protein
MSEKFEIRSDIPVPEIRRGAPRTGYPFARLEVGHCFFVAAGEEAEKVVERMKGAAARWRKVNSLKDRKFTVAATQHPDDPMAQVVVGVWRTA